VSVSFLAFNSFDASSVDDGNQYVGSTSCRPCHQHIKHNQYKIWRDSAHANAFKALKTDKAKEVAAKTGVKGPPEKAEACLVCHATGYNLDAKRLGKKFNVEEGVQCETCHNAGSGYGKLQTMKDHAKSVAAGMSDFFAEGAVEKLCAECHNEKSPTYKGFDFAKRWAEIEHNYPERKLVLRQTK
jgi:RecJ-like exonuclease